MVNNQRNLTRASKANDKPAYRAHLSLMLHGALGGALDEALDDQVLFSHAFNDDLDGSGSCGTFEEVEEGGDTRMIRV